MKYFVPFVFIIGILILFRVFFLDSLIKDSLIKSGQAVFGAKVSIQSIKIELLKGRFSIKRVQVGNAKIPMKNLFTFESATFSMPLKSLLRQYYHIEILALEGLEFATPRKISATLPKHNEIKKPTTSLPSNSKLVTSVTQHFSLSEINDRLRMPEITKLNDFKAVAQISSASHIISQTIPQVSTILASPNINIKINQILEQWQMLNKIKRTTIQDYQSILPQLTTLKNSINTTLMEIDHTRENITETIQSAQTAISLAQQAVQNDIQTLQNKISLANQSATHLPDEILGKEYLEYIDKAQDGLTFIKKFNTKTSPKKTWLNHFNVKGTNIEFPITHPLPKFWLQEAKVTGKLPSLPDKNSTQFLGVIHEIVSNQNMRQLPTTLEFSTVEANQQKRYLRGIMDFRNKKELIQFDLGMENMILQPTYWDDEQFPFHIVSGNYALTGNIKLNHSDFSSEIWLNAEKAQFKTTQHYDKNNLIHSFCKTLLDDTSNYSVHFIFNQGHFIADTNLDEIIQAKLQSLINEQIKQAKRNIDQALNIKLNELNSQWTANKKAIELSANQQMQSWQEQLNILNIELDIKQKEWTTYQDQLKKQVTDRINQEVTNQQQALEQKTKQEVNRQQQEMERKKNELLEQQKKEFLKKLPF